MTRDEVCLAVVAELKRLGLKPTYEYPGFIKLPRPDRPGCFAIGDANETWGADVYADDQMLDVVDYVESRIYRESIEVRRIANWIVSVVGAKQRKEVQHGS